MEKPAKRDRGQVGRTQEVQKERRRRITAQQRVKGEIHSKFRIVSKRIRQIPFKNEVVDLIRF